MLSPPLPAVRVPVLLEVLDATFDLAMDIPLLRTLDSHEADGLTSADVKDIFVGLCWWERRTVLAWWLLAARPSVERPVKPVTDGVKPPWRQTIKEEYPNDLKKEIVSRLLCFICLWNFSKSYNNMFRISAESIAGTSFGRKGVSSPLIIKKQKFLWEKWNRNFQAVAPDFWKHFFEARFFREIFRFWNLPPTWKSWNDVPGAVSSN